MRRGRDGKRKRPMMKAWLVVWCVPKYRVIYMPHPLSTCPDAELQEHACRVAGQVVQILLTASVD